MPTWRKRTEAPTKPGQWGYTELLAQEIVADYPKLRETYGPYVCITDMIDYYGEEYSTLRTSIERLMKAKLATWDYDVDCARRVGGKKVRILRLRA